MNTTRFANCPGKSSTCKLNEEDVRILPDTFTDVEESLGNSQTYTAS